MWLLQMSKSEKKTALNRSGKLYCSACGIELESEEKQYILMGKYRFCLWCWSNDCCRVSRDAAEEQQEEDKLL